jgi:hypothetical protein
MVGTGASSCTLIPLKTKWLSEFPNLYTHTHTHTHTHAQPTHPYAHTHTHNTHTHTSHTQYAQKHTHIENCRPTTHPPTRPCILPQPPTHTHRPSHPNKAPSFSLCPHFPPSLPLRWWNECYRAARAAQLTAAHVTEYYKPQISNKCVPYNLNTIRPTSEKAEKSQL